MNTILAITFVVTGTVILGGMPIGLVLYWIRRDQRDDELIDMYLRYKQAETGQGTTR